MEVITDAIQSENRTKVFKDEFFKNNDIDERKYFNRYKFDLVDQDPGVKGIPMIFITAPTISLSSSNVENDGFFKYLADHDPDLLKSLAYTESGRPFIPIFSNRMSEFSVPDHTFQTTEVGETQYGYVQNLPHYAPVTDTTNITYIDNANLDVLKIHKAWFDYIVHVTRGTMTPNYAAIHGRYIDYTASIYHFILDMDGETIQYFDKLTGCFPTNVPFSEFSSKVGNNQEIIEYSIDYSYSYKEFMSPSILSDFNNVANNATSLLTNTESEYRREYDMSSNEVNEGEDFLVAKDHSELAMPSVFQDGNKYKLLFSK